MKKETDKQIDALLQETEYRLSNFEKSTRSILNSEFSEKIDRLFNLFFEAKTFAISIFTSTIIYYIVFFTSIIHSFRVSSNLILILTAVFYIVLRIVKLIKNTIK